MSQGLLIKASVFKWWPMLLDTTFSKVLHSNLTRTSHVFILIIKTHNKEKEWNSLQWISQQSLTNCHKTGLLIWHEPCKRRNTETWVQNKSQGYIANFRFTFFPSSRRTRCFHLPVNMCSLRPRILGNLTPSCFLRNSCNKFLIFKASSM